MYIWRLRTLKTHASLLGLAKDVAGLHLKRIKCVIIVSCIPLSDELVTRIRNWLEANVPDFIEFKICTAGKYLGWTLGVSAISISFQEPLKKFTLRVEEVCAGNAPSTTSICRYNQRAVSVLSYVAQFSPPPKEANVADLSHWAVHKILKMPPR